MVQQKCFVESLRKSFDDDLCFQPDSEFPNSHEQQVQLTPERMTAQQVVPDCATNLFARKIRAATLPKLEPEIKSEFQGTAPSKFSDSETSSIESLPELEDEQGNSSSPKRKRGRPRLHETRKIRDRAWDPKKSKVKKQNRRNVPWHEALVRGGKMSGARYTRVKFDSSSGKWEARLRLDPILPFKSIGFFDSEHAANVAIKAQRAAQRGPKQKEIPSLARTRSRTGNLRPVSWETLNSRPGKIEGVRAFKSEPNSPKLHGNSKPRRRKKRRRRRRLRKDIHLQDASSLLSRVPPSSAVPLFSKQTYATEEHFQKKNTKDLKQR